MSKNTKVAKSKLIGGVKFPPHEDQIISEVITYKMTPEEIREKYGPSPADIFTYEVFLEYLKKRTINEQF